MDAGSYQLGSCSTILRVHVRITYHEVSCVRFPYFFSLLSLFHSLLSFSRQPQGGVQEGERFMASVIRENAADSEAEHIPVGHWRDGLCDCCIHGCCHPLCCLAFWCSPGKLVALNDPISLSTTVLFLTMHLLPPCTLILGSGSGSSHDTDAFGLDGKLHWKYQSWHDRL